MITFEGKVYNVNLAITGLIQCNIISLYNPLNIASPVIHENPMILNRYYPRRSALRDGLYAYRQYCSILRAFLSGRMDPIIWSWLGQITILPDFGGSVRFGSFSTSDL